MKLSAEKSSINSEACLYYHGSESWRMFYRVEPELVFVEFIGRKKGNVLLIDGKESEL